MLLMLPLGILFGLSSGTAALQGEIEGSLSAVAAAPVPVADLVQALQVEMMLVKKTQLKQQGENTGLKSELTELRKENTGLKSELIELRQESEEMKTKLQLVEKESEEMKTKLQLVEKENTGLKSELIDLRKVVSSSMDPQLKDHVMNTIKLGSIEEDVKQNQEDIIDLRINVGHHDMQIGQLLNQIISVNTTLNGEIVKLDERLEEQLTNVEERLTSVEEQLTDVEGQLTNVEERLTSVEDLGSGLQQEVGIVEADVRAIRDDVNNITADIAAMDGRLSKAEMRTAACGYLDTLVFSSSTTLTFDRVYDEVNSGGVLEKSGYFTATIAGVYFVDLKATVELDSGDYLRGNLKLSSGNYTYNREERFISSYNHGGGSGYIRDQASASRYVSMAAGETLHISLEAHYGVVAVYYTTMCVSLYSASG